MSDLDIRLGPLRFEETRRFGSMFVISPGGLDGWEDGAGYRGGQVEMPATHGDYDLPVYLEARTIRISGVAIAGTPRELAGLGGRLRSVGGTGELQRLVVEQHGVTQWADVRRAPGSQPRFESVGEADDGAWYAEVQLTLRAADPRKYGETNTYTGASGVDFDVWQYGGFPASPVLTVTGSHAGGYSIYGPGGRRYNVTANLVSGHPHVIDTRTGRLTIDGLVIVGGVSRAEVWTIPPGIMSSHRLDASGASLTVSVTDTDL